MLIAKNRADSQNMAIYSALLIIQSLKTKLFYIKLFNLRDNLKKTHLRSIVLLVVNIIRMTARKRNLSAIDSLIIMRKQFILPVCLV